MTKVIARLFDDRAQAMEAAQHLETMGVPPENISIIANNSDDWFDERTHNERHGKKRGKKDADNDGRDDRGEGASKGAGLGAVAGGGAGLLAGLGLLAIPGLGPVVAAGWLASTAVGAAAGAVVGGAAGGLIGALTKEGVTEEDAHVYSEGVRRGGTLLTVRVAEPRADEIDAVLRQHDGVDAYTRGRDYRAAGWTRFDENAPPYDRDEIVRERSRYLDQRPH